MNSNSLEKVNIAKTQIKKRYFEDRIFRYLRKTENKFHENELQP